MKTEFVGKSVVIFVSETDHLGHEPLYAAIVEQAKRLGLAGATVTRGIMGYGASSRLHTASILQLSEDLPIRIEIIDIPNKIDEFLPMLDVMIKGGLVVVSDVKFDKYVLDPAAPPVL